MYDESALLKIVTAVPVIEKVLQVLDDYELPNYYLAGGAITQCVWNHQLGLAPLSRVKDFDVVYFCDEPVEREKQHEQNINQRLQGSLPVDVKNQANVHRWYGQKFGNDIAPLRDTESGIQTWLSAFAVGIRKTGSQYRVYAPYGLEDQHAMLLRPNKKTMSEANYLAMTASFKQRWPQVTIMNWSDTDS